MIEVEGMKFPLDRKYYTKDGAHLWLKPEGDFIRIGMDAFAAKMIGTLTALDVNKKQAKRGEVIGSFESAKYISKLYSPISGKIIDINNKILNNPRKVNKNPYNTWIFIIKPDNKEDEFENIIEGKDQIRSWISKEVKKLEKR